MICRNEDMNRWSYCNTSVVLANADYYYTKEQVDDLLEDVEGMTPQEVQEQIDWSIRNKADRQEVEALAQEVRANTQAILDRYTKAEVNNLLASYKTKLEANRDIAEYAAMDGDVLVLNAQNIG